MLSGKINISKNPKMIRIYKDGRRKEVIKEIKKTHKSQKRTNRFCNFQGSLDEFLEYEKKHFQT